MIQHLISATLIWLVALLLYELSFRRLQHHAANRGYLLAGLAMGLLLPLFPLRVSHDAPAALQAPMVRYAGMRQAAAEQLAPVVDASAPVVNWWLVLYAVGFVVAGGYLVYQAVAIVRIRRGAVVDSTHGRSFLRSSRVASPCSFFGWIILPESADYSPGELAMILRHEEEHRRLLHSVDVLVLAALRVVLWFHPLVYLYDRRLRMVHEFQADAPQRGDALAYGHMLVTQAMAGHAPALTHAFFQSPLKTRIAMLLKTSTATRLRYLTALLLLPVFFVCSAYTGGTKRVRKGNVVSLNGHVIKLDVVTDTTGQAEMINREGWVDDLGDTIPVALDGARIHILSELTKRPVWKGTKPSLLATIVDDLQPLLSQLPDGNYGAFMQDGVLDENGRIVYYESKGFSATPVELFEENGEVIPGFTIKLDDSDTAGMKALMDEQHISGNTEPTTVPLDKMHLKSKVPPKLKARIDARLDELLLNEARYEPGEIQGKPVVSRISQNEIDLFIGHIIVVKNGKATLTRAFQTQ